MLGRHFSFINLVHEKKVLKSQALGLGLHPQDVSIGSDKQHGSVRSAEGAIAGGFTGQNVAEQRSLRIENENATRPGGPNVTLGIHGQSIGQAFYFGALMGGGVVEEPALTDGSIGTRWEKKYRLGYRDVTGPHRGFLRRVKVRFRWGVRFPW